MHAVLHRIRVPPRLLAYDPRHSIEFAEQSRILTATAGRCRQDAIDFDGGFLADPTFFVRAQGHVQLKSPTGLRHGDNHEYSRIASVGKDDQRVNQRGGGNTRFIFWPCFWAEATEGWGKANCRSSDYFARPDGQYCHLGAFRIRPRARLYHVTPKRLGLLRLCDSYLRKPLRSALAPHFLCIDGDRAVAGRTVRSTTRCYQRVGGDWPSRGGRPCAMACCHAGAASAASPCRCAGPG